MLRKTFFTSSEVVEVRTLNVALFEKQPLLSIPHCRPAIPLFAPSPFFSQLAGTCIFIYTISTSLKLGFADENGYINQFMIVSTTNSANTDANTKKILLDFLETAISHMTPIKFYLKI